MTMSARPKFPVRGVGQGWNDGLIADATIELRSSGLVGTAYGFPGISATLIGTGVYDIRYPVAAERGVRIYPHAMPPELKGPTGALLPPAGSGGVPDFGVHMSHVGAQSGWARLNTTSNKLTASGAIAGVPSGSPSQPINPPTGAVINLQFLVSPITRY
jgi:hypothetical protein